MAPHFLKVVPEDTTQRGLLLLSTTSDRGRGDSNQQSDEEQGVMRRSGSVFEIDSSERVQHQRLGQASSGEVAQME